MILSNISDLRLYSNCSFQCNLNKRPSQYHIMNLKPFSMIQWWNCLYKSIVIVPKVYFMKIDSATWLQHRKCHVRTATYAMKLLLWTPSGWSQFFNSFQNKLAIAYWSISFNVLWCEWHIRTSNEPHNPVSTFHILHRSLLS